MKTFDPKTPPPPPPAPPSAEPEIIENRGGPY